MTRTLLQSYCDADSISIWDIHGETFDECFEDLLVSSAALLAIITAAVFSCTHCITATSQRKDRQPFGSDCTLVSFWQTQSSWAFLVHKLVAGYLALSPLVVFTVELLITNEEHVHHEKVSTSRYTRMLLQCAAWFVATSALFTIHKQESWSRTRARSDITRNSTHHTRAQSSLSQAQGYSFASVHPNSNTRAGSSSSPSYPSSISSTPSLSLGISRPPSHCLTVDSRGSRVTSSVSSACIHQNHGIHQPNHPNHSHSHYPAESLTHSGSGSGSHSQSPSDAHAQSHASIQSQTFRKLAAATQPAGPRHHHPNSNGISNGSISSNVDDQGRMAYNRTDPHNSHTRHNTFSGSSYDQHRGRRPTDEGHSTGSITAEMGNMMDIVASQYRKYQHFCTWVLICTCTQACSLWSQLHKIMHAGHITEVDVWSMSELITSCMLVILALAVLHVRVTTHRRSMRVSQYASLQTEHSLRLQEIEAERQRTHARFLHAFMGVVEQKVTYIDAKEQREVSRSPTLLRQHTNIQYPGYLSSTQQLQPISSSALSSSTMTASAAEATQPASTSASTSASVPHVQIPAYSSWWSLFSFDFVQPILQIGRLDKLQIGDMFPLVGSDATAGVTGQFAVHWQRELRRGRRSEERRDGQKRRKRKILKGSKTLGKEKGREERLHQQPETGVYINHNSARLYTELGDAADHDYEYYDYLHNRGDAHDSDTDDEDEFSDDLEDDDENRSSCSSACSSLLCCFSSPSLMKALNSSFGQEYWMVGLVKFCADALNLMGPVFLEKLVSFVQTKSEENASDPSAATASTTPMYMGYVWASCMVCASVLNAVLGTQYSFHMKRVALRVRGSIINAVYRKSLTIDASAKRRFTMGQITNIMSVDSDRMMNVCVSFHEFWSLPVQIGLALYLLYTQVQEALLAGLAVILLMIPINAYLTKQIAAVSQRMMTQKDTRVELTNELLTNIRQIKMMALEDFFKQQIDAARAQEMQSLKTRKYLDAFCVYFWATTPILISLSTFSLYTYLGYELTAGKVFTSLALFNTLIGPLNAFPWVVNGLVEGSVSVMRIHDFLTAKDRKTRAASSATPPPPSSSPSVPCVAITNGTFAYVREEGSCEEEGETSGGKDATEEHKTNSSNDRSGEPAHEAHQDHPHRSQHNRKGNAVVNVVLHGINMQVEHGEFIGVSGSIGSGKSSLLLALLGELTSISGSVSIDLPRSPRAMNAGERKKEQLGRTGMYANRNHQKHHDIDRRGNMNGVHRHSGMHGSNRTRDHRYTHAASERIAYVSQEAWIQNDTVRNNIIFGLPYNAEKYNTVVQACALETDFQQLVAGDNTEIGESGINLSGGQKVRISLARAVYSGADLFLLDDPLSAVDVHVGAKLMQCFRTLLHGKTRILVTHHTRMFEGMVDRVFHMEAGRLVDHSHLYESNSNSDHQHSGGRSGGGSDRCHRTKDTLAHSISTTLDGCASTCVVRNVDKNLMRRSENNNEYSGSEESDRKRAFSQYRKASAGSMVVLKSATFAQHDGDDDDSRKIYNSTNRADQQRRAGLDTKTKGSVLGVNIDGAGNSTGDGGEDDDEVEGADNARGGLTTEEGRQTGKVKLNVLCSYLYFVGWFTAMLIVLSLVLMQFSRNFNDWWLARWVTHIENQADSGDDPALAFTSAAYGGDGDGDNVSEWWGFFYMNALLNPPSFAWPHFQKSTFFRAGAGIGVDAGAGATVSTTADSTNDQTFYYLSILAYAGLANTVCTLFRSFIFAYGGLKGAERLYNKLLTSVINASVLFFDQNPVGRILNRFSTDVYAVDENIPFQSNIFLATAFGLLGSLTIIGLTAPLVFVLILPLGILYYRAQKVYRFASRELRRLDSVSRSPIYSHFSETLSGTTTIRAFHAEARFIEKNLLLLDHNQRIQWCSCACSQWLSFRLQFVASLVVMLVSFMGVLDLQYGRETHPALLGLALSYAYPLAGTFNGLIGSFAETEKEIVSVERCCEYMNIVPEAEELADAGKETRSRLSSVASKEQKGGGKKMKERQTREHQEMQSLQQRHRLQQKGVMMTQMNSSQQGSINREVVSTNAGAWTTPLLDFADNDAGIYVIDSTAFADFDVGVDIENGRSADTSHTYSDEDDTTHHAHAQTHVHTKSPLPPPVDVPYHWPLHGKIQAQAMTMAYREGLPPALNAVSFAINTGEHVGIVGRTGSGKSSLFQVLFRMRGLSGGSLLIDGVDIARVPLKTLRERLSIIPQTPVLFSGSLRDNLDPRHVHDEGSIWRMLEKCCIADKIRSLASFDSASAPAPAPASASASVLTGSSVATGALDSMINESFDFSVGERQLLCLARALLKGSQIVMLDEATASVDMHTDEVIQRLLREELKGKTVLIIAHRIDTILDCDRVLVMDAGRVQEFAPPAVLLENKRSAFSLLCEGSKIAAVDADADAQQDSGFVSHGDVEGVRDGDHRGVVKRNGCGHPTELNDASGDNKTDIDNEANDDNDDDNDDDEEEDGMYNPVKSLSPPRSFLDIDPLAVE